MEFDLFKVGDTVEVDMKYANHGVFRYEICEVLSVREQLGLCHVDIEGVDMKFTVHILDFMNPRKILK